MLCWAPSHLAGFDQFVHLPSSSLVPICGLLVSPSPGGGEQSTCPASCKANCNTAAVGTRILYNVVLVAVARRDDDGILDTIITSSACVLVDTVSTKNICTIRCGICNHVLVTTIHHGITASSHSPAEHLVSSWNSHRQHLDSDTIVITSIAQAQRPPSCQ